MKTLKRSPSGTVCRAKHTLMGREVLIKIMPDAAKTHADVRKRFEREIRLAAQLSHPNLISAYHAGDKDGTLYLVMEDVQGSDLAQLVKQKGPLEVDVAVDYVMQAAKGLGYLHDQGVFHRNVKPGNLTVDRFGIVYVSNMTSALVDVDSEIEVGDDDDLTRQGQLLGTAQYMAPEQGFDAHVADARSDIYSLGCTLHFLLTGKPPYPEDDPRKRVTAHTQRPIPSLRIARPDVSEKLESVFKKMLAKMPTDRYQTMSELTTDLNYATYGGDDLIASRKASFRWELVLTALAIGLFVGTLATLVVSAAL